MTALRSSGEDGGGDILAVDETCNQIKSKQNKEILAQHYETGPYEGCHQKSIEKVAALEEEPRCSCPHNDGETAQQKSSQKPAERVPHRRHEDQRHFLQSDFSNEVEKAKEGLQRKNLSPISTDCFSDGEMESSPLIEDKSKEIRLKRQQQYREELAQQITQREEARLQQKAKKNFRASQRFQEAARSAAAPTRGSRAAVESYENQLRMEQMDEMRRQLQLQREKEIQRLRLLYRKDDRKFLAHLRRLKLQESDLSGQGEGNGSAEIQRTVASAKPETPPSNESDHKISELKHELITGEAIPPEPEVSQTDPSAKVASLRTPSENILGKKDNGDHIQARSSSTTVPADALEKHPTKPLTPKRAYLRLQQQRRAEEILLEEKRAKAAAWRSEIARQERLERDVRNMAEWRARYSLAGVPLTPISSAQRSKFEAAASWLEKHRAAQQEKRIERDRQLSSWRDEKDRQIKEMRSKEKAEQKVALEMQNERRKEAENRFQRWLLEIRARKAAAKASVPRGAIGVSTYSSAYSLPLPWRRPPRKVWRGKKWVLASSPSGKSKENVTHKVLY